MPSATSSLFTLLSIGAVQLLAVMSPGPSFLITARTAVAKSRVEGIKVALGLGAGAGIWAIAALLGLHLLFARVPMLYNAVQLAGSLFLLWIAWKIFAHAADPIRLDGVEEGGPGGSAFLKGFLTQVTNPKVVVFFGSVFVAMLPADVPLWMMVALVAIVTFNDFWWYSAVSLFFATGPVRAFYLRAKKWIDRVTAVFLGIIGLRLLWALRAGG